MAKNCNCQHRKSHVAFQLEYLYSIFKIRHIFTMNISQTVTYYIILLLPSYMKSHIVFKLACLHLTLTISKGKGQAYFNYGYLANGEIEHTLLLPTNMKPHMAFRFTYLHLTLTQGRAHFRCEYLTNGYIYMRSIGVANRCEVAHMACRATYIHLIFTFSKINVKFVHISTVNISQTVSDGANITIANR